MKKRLGQASAPDSIVQALANAIATAEGFFSAGSLPQRANNPGDLELGDQGQGTIAGKTIFASLQDGWDALYHQVSLMLTGASRIYSPSMTISQIAGFYTGGDNPTSWATNVANALGVGVDTTLQDLLGVIPGSSTGGPDAGTLALFIIGGIFIFLAII